MCIFSSYLLLCVVFISKADRGKRENSFMAGANVLYEPRMCARILDAIQEQTDKENDKHSALLLDDFSNTMNRVCHTQAFPANFL